MLHRLSGGILSVQVLVTALYQAEIGHYGTEVTQRRLRRVFRLPDVSLEWDSVRHSLSADGRLYIEIQLKPMRPYKCQLTTEELPLANDAAAGVDDVSSTCEVDDSRTEPLPGPSSCAAASPAAAATTSVVQNDLIHVQEPT